MTKMRAEYKKDERKSWLVVKQVQIQVMEQMKPEQYTVTLLFGVKGFIFKVNIPKLRYPIH